MRDYQTAQRKALVELFYKHPGRKLSTDDILRELSAEQSISRSAVYRNLDRMTKDGLIERTAGEGRGSLYSYAGREARCERVHLRCERCGRVFHMRAQSDEEKLESLLRESGLSMDGRATIIPGVCEGCEQPETEKKKN